MVSIGSLRYDIIADHSQFTAGMLASRKELSVAKKLFLETRTPVESLGIEIDGLAKLLHKGAIDSETFGRTIKSMGDGTKESMAAQDAMVDSLRREAKAIDEVTAGMEDYLPDERERAKSLRETATATERLLREERQQRAAADAAANAEADRVRIMDRGISTTRRYETATERLDRELGQLKQELRAGAISQATYARAVDHATREIRQQQAAMLDQVPGLGRINRAFTMMNPATLAAAAGIGAVTIGMVAAARAVSFLTDKISTQMQELDKLAKTGRKLGIATDELVVLRLAAAEFSGMAEGQFDTALQRMTRRLAEAAQGTGEAQGAIKELGVDAVKLSQAGPAEAFRQIADAIQSVESPADRLRLAFKLFDSEGAGLVTTLSAGRDALDGVERAARELGLTIDEIDASQIEAANDAMGRASAATEGLYNDLAILLSPAIVAVAEELQMLAKWLQGVDSGFGDSSIVIAGYIGSLADLGKGIAGLARITAGDIFGGQQMLAEAMQFESAARMAIAAAQAVADARDQAAKRENAPPGQDMEAELDKIKAAEAAAKEAKEGADAAKKAAEAAKKESNAIGRQIFALRERNLELLRGNAFAERYAILNGTGTEQQKEALLFWTRRNREQEKHNELVKAEVEARKQANNEMKQKADALVESVKTPFEKLVDELTDIEVLVRVGAIDQATADRARGKAGKDMMDSQTKPIKVELPPSAQRGSQEEYQLVASINSSAQADRQAAENRHREAQRVRDAQRIAAERAADRLDEIQINEGV